MVFLKNSKKSSIYNIELSQFLFHIFICFNLLFIILWGYGGSPTF